ncbi:MAG TPA: hypothetical protein VL523_01220 [Terriglobia bacterium]|nr:hypothetical protein [Terriglobia bacterium]
MKRNRRLLLGTLAAVLGFGAMAWAQTKYALQPAPALSTVSFPAPLAAMLDAQGSQLAPSGSAPTCNVWWLKSVATVTPTSTSPDILYNNLAVGTLLGALQVVAPDFADARGQKIKAGLYTLRYAMIPQDGNHMGVSEYRDFVLLSPAAADTQLDKALSFNDVVNLSRKATGTGHPGALSMVPATASGTLPAVGSDDQGDWFIQADLHESGAGGAKDVPIGLVLVGPPKGGQE